jgi:hypothetical protein
MKRCVSSSGCKTRPAKGEPVRADSKSCIGRGNKVDEAEVCERVDCGVATLNPLLPGCPGGYCT